MLSNSPVGSIGDLTVAGWAITGVYALASALSFRAWRREGTAGSNDKGYETFWLAIAAALLVLTINKQLDLHHAFTAILRDLVKELNLYERRRLLQSLFIAGLAMSLLLAMSMAAWIGGRPLLLRLPLTCCGTLLLLIFVLVRAASFHHVAKPISAPATLLLELAGPVLIGIDAVRVVARRDLGDRVLV